MIRKPRLLNNNRKIGGVLLGGALCGEQVNSARCCWSWSSEQHQLSRASVEAVALAVEAVSTAEVVALAAASEWEVVASMAREARASAWGVVASMVRELVASD